jgi:peptide subunit release factor RF-3
LDEYRSVTGEKLYEDSIEKVQKIDNFSPESFRRIMLSSISNRLINKTNSSKNKTKELQQLHGVIKILNNPYY